MQLREVALMKEVSVLVGFDWPEVEVASYLPEGSCGDCRVERYHSGGRDGVGMSISSCFRIDDKG
jgi:hypothetical protein